jgi:hypothetical protein
MSKVYVLSVRPGFRAVTFGTWGNTAAAVFGGFSSNPKAYQIRRLVKQRSTGTPSTGTAAAEAWELIDPSKSKLDVEMKYNDDQFLAAHNQAGVENRWIPNTGEAINFEVALTPQNAAGNTIPLLESENNVKLLPPEDRFAKGDLADSSNIYDNKGEGFDFGVTAASGQFVVIAEIRRNESGYTVRPSVDYFTSDWAAGPKNGRLHIVGGKLFFSCDQGADRLR